MDRLFGNWKLKKNINFELFLEHCGYGWMQRKVAVASSIDLEILSGGPDRIRRKIKSAFFNTNEEYVIDDKFHMNKDGIKKKNSFTNNILTTFAEGTQMSWIERAYISGTELHVERTWKEKSGIYRSCKQIFIKK